MKNNQHHSHGNIWSKSPIYLILFTVFAVLMLIQSYQYHRKNDSTIWKKENHADAAGYFAHLLMWYDYGYYSKNYPPDIDSALGKGFKLDCSIVKDKYTCGEAYLLSPFYLVSRLFYKKDKIFADSIELRRTIDIAAIFYLWAGAICLFYFLSHYFNKLIAFISITSIIIGTNVYFYAVHHPGMSHIYSFFLFSAYLLLGLSIIKKNSIKNALMLGLVGSCIVLIRPTDVIFLPIILFLSKDTKKNFSILIRPRNLVIWVITSVLIFFPQLYYWHQLSGHWIYYSYGNEGFSNMSHPKILQVLFAPYNGLIPYSLIFIFLFLANIYAVYKKVPYAIYFLVYQILSIYIISSWWAPTFGDGYGQRNFVQTFAGYAFIAAYGFQQMLIHKNRILIIVVTLFIFMSIAVNQKIISKYDHVYAGRTVWNWNEYYYYINFNRLMVNINFESTSQNPSIKRYPQARSGHQILEVTPDTADYVLWEFYKKEIPSGTRIIKCNLYIQSLEKDFGYNIILKHNNTAVGYAGKPHYNFPINKWEKSKNIMYYQIPEELPKDAKFTVLLVNWNNATFKVDDVQLEFY